MKKPENVEPVKSGRGYQAQYRAIEPNRKEPIAFDARTLNESQCLHLIGDAHEEVGGKSPWLGLEPLLGERLSRNDLLQVILDGDDVFSGEFVVSRDGMLKLPHLPSILAQGRSVEQVEESLSKALLDGQFYNNLPRLSVRVADFAAVSVGVSGAVFEPHAVQIGAISGDSLDKRRQGALGSSNEGRNLAAALRSAGGVRPDADISAVELHRGGKIYQMDLRGVFDGSDPTDIMMLAGDQLSVKSRECFQQDLMRPSPISPPGITLFLSNLTQPATGNAISAVGRTVREVPYGTRYIQAVVDTNCVGGTKATSANRSAVLVSRNPMTEVSVVIERDIEDLLRRANRDEFDPFLLPGDAIACYDSSITNLAEIGRVLGVIGTALLIAP